MTRKRDQHGVNRFGYGALALYALGVLVMALGVYGINVSTIVSSRNESERMREQVRSGSMVVGTSEYARCRTYRFDNVTAEVTAEKMVDCEPPTAPGGRSSKSGFNIFQRGFQSR